MSISGWAAIFIAAKTLFLLLYANELSIGYDEALIVYASGGLSHWLCSVSLWAFGQNDVALRAPFILLHAVSSMLIFELSRKRLKKESDALLALILFSALPGVNLSAILVNKAGVLLAFTLSFVALYERHRTASFLLLVVAALCENAFAILFLALFFFAVQRKDNRLLILSTLLFSVSIGRFGFDDGGLPKSYFLDTLGIYAAIFSPLVFIYFVYSLYKFRQLAYASIGWTISFWAFLFSLLLSFRQKISIIDFTPFVVLAAPLMVRVFASSYRVRIAVNRGFYNVAFALIALSLLLTTAIAFANKPLYAVLQKPSSHFAYGYHVAKELSDELKKLGVTQISCEDEKLALRLKFYGIASGGGWLLSMDEKPDSKKVSIVYLDRVAATYYVTYRNTF